MVLSAVLFIALNSIFIYQERLPMIIAPIVGLAAMLVLFAPNFVFYSLFLLAPLSVPLRGIIPDLEFDMWFPTEPFIFALLLILILKSLQARYFEPKITNHPIFWAILLYIGGLLIASVGSQMPLVSLKYTLVRVWFISVFFYLSYMELLKKPDAIFKMMGLYVAGLLVVVAIALARQAHRGLLDRYVAHGTCVPFFPDHTSYGAALAFIIPVAIGMAVSVRNGYLKILLYSLSALFVGALVLSFTRAAWLSLAAGIAVWFLWRIRIKLRTLLITGVAVALLVLAFWGDIVRWMSSNETASSGGLKAQVVSITNITTDDSNVERINRWSCAMQMFAERPALGFGPGTYQFVYAPYQMSYRITAESSNQGAKGNAHSEYLGLMAESGVPATLGFLLIVFLTIARSFKLTHSILEGKERIMALSMLIGFITYITHGALNNFLDMDKIACLFWLTVAYVVAVDVRNREGIRGASMEQGDNF